MRIDGCPVISKSDIRVMLAGVAWIAVWVLLGAAFSWLPNAEKVDLQTARFSSFVGLFIGAIVGVFGSTESRGSRNQNIFVVGAILFGSALPILFPGHTARNQWACNMAAIGAGALLAFPVARFAAAAIRRVMNSRAKDDSGE